MRLKRIVNGLKRAYSCYDRFMERQGFGIVLAVCVLMIVSSAVYTFCLRPEQTIVAEIQQADVQAGGVQNAQTLQQAQEQISSQSAPQFAVPTEAPLTFTQPVEGFLDRDYSMHEPQYFAVPNYYRLHPGIDLQTSYGACVKACAAGTVLRVWQDNELGLCIRIRHHNGYEAVYAGLSDASYVLQGDPVVQGQTIGHVGNGVLAENDAKPHLHLEIWLNETPVDPVELFLGL